MADQEVTAQQVVSMPHDLYARREMAREIEAQRKAGIKLDEAKRPGGYYIGVDGKAHDAEGRPIEEPAPEAEAPKEKAKK